MNLTTPVTLVYVLVVILMVVVTVTGYVTLLNAKIEMIYHLRPYADHLANTGELSSEIQQQAIACLSRMGLRDIRIEVESAGAFGEVAGFDVKAGLDRVGFTGFLNRLVSHYDLHYHREIFIRRIVN